MKVIKNIALAILSVLLSAMPAIILTFRAPTRVTLRNSNIQMATALGIIGLVSIAIILLLIRLIAKRWGIKIRWPFYLISIITFIAYII